MNASEALSDSLEDYIEAIYHLVSENKVARARDIAQRVGVNRSSVTGALHALAERDLVNYSPYDFITLTQEGERVARGVVKRHEALKDFFIKVLRVGGQEADDAACKMEHAISPLILKRFMEFVQFVEGCPRAGTDWLEGFGSYCNRGESEGNCERCIEQCLESVRKSPHRAG